MGFYKEGKNWKVQVYYKDWQGNRKRKQKRGFRTKGEAKEWERDFLQQQSQGVDIEFGNFLEIYYKDMDVRLRENTMYTKRYIIDLKIKPYFEKKILSEITVADVRAWQNELLTYKDKVNEDNRAFLHDINKFICTVAGLIEEGENQEVKDIMEHLGVRIQNLQKSVYCEHPILNTILCERKFLAESKDISYRITLGNDLRLDFLEELDLISIVGNLLDNALEAAEKTEDGRYVECRMYMGNAGHFLVMEFCNGYVVPLLKDKDRYISTKRDADSHGIGLHTVGKLVKKYAGIMRVEAGEREFSVKLIFTIK